MSKFAAKGKAMKPKGHTNYEGGESFVHSDEATLLQLTATCMMQEPKFYGEDGATEEKIFNLAKKVDPQFVFQLAAYARRELNLRSAPMYLLSIGANRQDGKKFTREYAPKIISRADELYESTACYFHLFGKPFPNSFKKGVADSFAKFDEYQLAKYDRKGDFTLKDVMCITHPKQPAALLKKLHDETLKTPMTWETEISGKGNKPEVWESLIDAEKLPYMAMLRNLRNLLTTGEKGISEAHLDKVISILREPDRVRNSRQFPFRFLSAYRELSNEGGRYDYYGNTSPRVTHTRVSEVLDALEDAMFIAYENLPYQDGTTLISCDVSGSMNGPISGRSKIRHIDIGLVLGSAMHKYCEKSIFSLFGTNFKTYNIPKKSSGIISNIPKLINHVREIGMATNGHLIVEYMNQNNIFVDRVMVFTDCELYDSSGYAGWGGSRSSNSIRKEMEKYWKNVNPNCRVYMFNLNGYGDFNFPDSEKRVMNIQGWSEKILKFINMSEKDPAAQLNYIKQNY